MIILTVDDEILDFVDDLYLINVAVSRAKEKLVLAVTRNERKRQTGLMLTVKTTYYA